MASILRLRGLKVLLAATSRAAPFAPTPELNVVGAVGGTQAAIPGTTAPVCVVNVLAATVCSGAIGQRETGRIFAEKPLYPY